MRAVTTGAGYRLVLVVDEPAEVFDDLYLGIRAGGALRKKRRGEPLTTEEQEAIGRWQRLSTWRKSIASAPSQSGRSASASPSAASCSAAGEKPEVSFFFFFFFFFKKKKKKFSPPSGRRERLAPPPRRGLFRTRARSMIVAKTATNGMARMTLEARRWSYRSSPTAAAAMAAAVCRRPGASPCRSADRSFQVTGGDTSAARPAWRRRGRAGRGSVLLSIASCRCLRAWVTSPSCQSARPSQKWNSWL